ncbi:2-amino-4-hydroxy-6-hydroxymethyldihydropteridine diphosphokinase [Halopseudomonas salegens]|uniref:2-amino-4-hydroxy-6-hydroxymethyldihydropteridine pyrophosphokinase n=1 Tax=Halopseudomonas salegens TaxID=1434072 RepID=A0A1H2I470_9GAMM|nr:2-amino-4-hydroxy-6-hydroxymethyldihydropteridine diphosphokinase [Halopseudomonas salegens]SDU38755.1 2-amino-4-hydroxy-6-hydroxymethyldihydropteridinediphosphokinase [Halopseudomonas salegens]
MPRCYIGLGSNQANPERQLQQAFNALAMLTQSELVARSSLYRSAPMGPQEQPDYVNAVACLDTALAPLALLDQLQAIEQLHGRERKAERWGPRTLDLDLLLYDQLSIDLPRLTVPHYGLQYRDFVLQPLAELEPEMVLPNGCRVAELLQQCQSHGLQRLNPPEP